MSTCWDALASVIVLLLILSTSLVLLSDKDRIIASPSMPYTGSSDMGTVFDGNEPVALVTPGKAGIAITFNGWAVDNWYSIRSLLNMYEAKATFFVSNLGDLTSDDFEKLRALRDNGHEIATQGLRYLDAVEFMKNHSLQTYLDEEIFPAVNLMSEQGLTPTSFAYPFGSRNSTIDAELIEYFVILRGTTYTSNETRVVDLDQAYYDWQYTGVLQAVGVDNTYENTVEEIVEGLERAKSNNEVLLLYGHIPSTTSDEYVTPIDKLETILSSAEAMELVFYRVSDLVFSTTDSTPINTGGTSITNRTGGLNDILISTIVSCVGVGLLWAIVSIIFRDEQKWRSYTTE